MRRRTVRSWPPSGDVGPAPWPRPRCPRAGPTHPVLARVYDAAVEDRPDGQAHLAHVIRLGDVLGGSVGQPEGDAAPAAATISTAAAAPVTRPGECPVRSVDKATTWRHGPHRIGQQRPPSPREALQGAGGGCRTSGASRLARPGGAGRPMPAVHLVRAHPAAVSRGRALQPPAGLGHRSRPEPGSARPATSQASRARRGECRTARGPGLGPERPAPMGGRGETRRPQRPQWTSRPPPRAAMCPVGPCPQHQLPTGPRTASKAAPTSSDGRPRAPRRRR